MNELEINIIYEDDNLMVINKPAGLLVHPDGKTTEYTLTDWIIKKYPKLKNIGEPVEYDGKTILRPGIVHRIDRNTTGVLVIAKNQDTFLDLKHQFKKRSIRKTYRAIVYGNIKKDSGVIDKPIGRSARDFRAWSAEITARGKLRDAVTEYKVLRRFSYDNPYNESSAFIIRGKLFTYLEIYPKTGRTHQIRVHLKYIKHPIVCDKLYAPKKKCALGLTRMALHAKSIELFLQNGSKIIVEAPLPEDFENALISGGL